MPPWRIALAVAAVLVVTALTGWRMHRERLIVRCHDAGGVWIGAQSRCAPDPNRMTIQRELYRSSSACRSDLVDADDARHGRHLAAPLRAGIELAGDRELELAAELVDADDDAHLSTPAVWRRR